MTDTESQSPIKLNHQERVTLVDRARSAIMHRLTHSTAPKPDERSMTEALKTPSGAFVSLHVEEELRGCIGSIYAEEPLVQIVAHMAVQAATQDPRFAPMQTSDLSKIDIEVSVLSELVPMVPDDVEVGVHGLLISKGSRRGLLLPQVPEQYGWTRAEFLSQLCLKAGLPDRSWTDPACRLLMFTADVFSDSTLFGDEDEDY
jgi:AmmeMemoRadiSam system protein A